MEGDFRVGVVEDLLLGVQVGQAGDAALAGTRAEGDQHLRLASEQLGHVLLFAGADTAIEQAHVDLAVRHPFDIADFAVRDAGAEDDIEGGGDVEDFRVDAED